MKNLFVKLFVLTCLPSIVFAESFTIGGNQIEIPSPAEFVRVTPKMDAVYRLSEQMVDPVNDQLAYYIPETERPMAETGEIPSLERTFMLKVNKELKSVVMGSNDFAKLINATKNQNQKIINEVKTKIPELFDKMNQDISKEFDIDFAMQLSQVVPLEPHYETPNAMSFSMFVTYNVKADGARQEDVVCCTTTFLNADGKVLFLYCYAPQSELEWTRQASKAWAETIMANNAQPPKQTSGNGGSGRNRGMIKWIVFGIIMAMVTIFKSVKKKNQETT